MSIVARPKGGQRFLHTSGEYMVELINDPYMTAECRLVNDDGSFASESEARPFRRGFTWETIEALAQPTGGKE